MSNSIYFHYEDVAPLEINENLLRNWLVKSSANEGFDIGEVNIIFCSDVYLLNVNRSFLGHDYFTDIITFDNSDEAGTILSDIYISLDRVSENTKTFNTTFKKELARVIIHGVLHLVGYNDKTDEEKVTMKDKENSYLSLLRNF